MKLIIRFLSVALAMLVCMFVLHMLNVGKSKLEDNFTSSADKNHVLHRRHTLTGEADIVNQDNMRNTKVDVMLFGYARGGSTYVGQILGHNDDTFYFYEPLLSKMEESLRYYRLDAVCEMNSPHCRQIDQQKISRTVAKIEAVFKCNPMVFPQFVWFWQRELGGKAWHDRNLTERCMKSKYRISKVLRISAELVEKLLKRNPMLKVVYLYRDPRGIINSRLKDRGIERWNMTMKNTEGVAKGVCLKMEKDIEVLLELKQNLEYQNRIYFTDYEGIAKNPVETSKHIFDFLGINVSDRYMKIVSILGKQSKTANWERNSALRSDGYAVSIKWRTEMNQNDKNDIDKHCFRVYRMLGYEIQ